MKDEGAHHSLTAVKDNMNSVLVHLLSLVRPFSVCLFFLSFPHICCLFAEFPLISHVEASFVGLPVVVIQAQSVADPPPGLLNLLSSLAALSGYERDHQ